MPQEACVLRSKLLCAMDELLVYRYCVVVLSTQEGNHLGVYKGKITFTGFLYSLCLTYG